MTQVKRKYEFPLVISCKLGENESEALIKKFQDLIQSHSELESIERWGKRKLAYPINKETEGNYTLFRFTSATDFPAELDRVSKITENVLRSLIVLRD